MAEKAEKKAEDRPAAAPAGAAPAEKKAGIGALIKSTPAMLVLVMVLEAGILLAAFKVLGGGPQNAHADIPLAGDAQGGGGHGDKKTDGGKAENKHAELSVLSFKAPNKLTGRTFLYDVSIFAVVKAENKDKVKQALADREATIQDKVRTIIAQSDPEKLGGGSEPGLETLRRQVKTQLDEILGDGLIEEIVVPRCIPYRAEF